MVDDWCFSIRARTRSRFYSLYAECIPVYTQMYPYLYTRICTSLANIQPACDCFGIICRSLRSNSIALWVGPAGRWPLLPCMACRRSDMDLCVFPPDRDFQGLSDRILSILIWDSRQSGDVWCSNCWGWRVYSWCKEDDRCLRCCHHDERCGSRYIHGLSRIAP